MLPLRLIGESYYYYDLTFLDFQDIPTIVVLIILMFIAYSKVRKYKPASDLEAHSLKEEVPAYLESRDILMQPKKYSNDFQIPFVNFSLRKAYIILGLSFLLFCLIYIWNYEIT